jgi:hypothetical protein
MLSHCNSSSTAKKKATKKRAAPKPWEMKVLPKTDWIDEGGLQKSHILPGKRQRTQR